MLTTWYVIANFKIEYDKWKASFMLTMWYVISTDKWKVYKVIRVLY